MIIDDTKKITCRVQLLVLVNALLLIFFQNIVIAESSENTFLIEPYLLEVDTNSATVAFHLKSSMKAKVFIFDADEVATFESEEKSISHFINISGLQAGRVYNYRVIGGDGKVQTPLGDSTYQIRTACRKGESFSFIVFGDPRPGENLTNKHHKKVIERAIQKEPAFSIVLGDMVDDGTDFELWRDFFSTEKELLRKAAIYPVIGDNDFARGKGLVKAFFPLLEKGYYHFEWGDVQFFGMNAWDSRGFQSQEELSAASEQLQWLESQLSEEKVQNSLYRIVFLHDPVLISRGYSSEILKNVWEPVFRKYKVDVVFASWHMYERSQHKGIRYIISGGAGAELLWLDKNPDYPAQAEAKTHHFCKVDVNAGAMTISAIDVNDTILDSLTISPKSKAVGGRLDLNTIAAKVRREIVIEGGNNLPVLPVHLFSYDSCSYCQQLLNRIFPKLARQYQISFKIHFYDLELHESVYGLFLSAGADFGYQNSDIPTIFVGSRVLGGKPEIESSLAEEISDFKYDPDEYIRHAIVPFQDPRDTKTIKENRFDGLSPAAVFGAGLAGGLKPCTTATLIVLMSFLIVTGGSKKKLFIAGLALVSAMFFTYIISGLSLSIFDFSISQNSIAAIALKWAVMSALPLAAALSILDNVKNSRHRSDAMNPPASQFYHRLLHRIRIIRTTPMIIMPAALMTGVVIALMERACTGQAYFPIVTMISEPAYRAKAVGYLFAYNLALILPIAGFFGIVLAGITSRNILWLKAKKEKF